jgi:hypothetical protein
MLPAMPVSRPASGRHAELRDDGEPLPFHLDRSSLNPAEPDCGPSRSYLAWTTAVAVFVPSDEV